MTQIKADWLAATETQKALGMLTMSGYEAYAVGGCVRNALMDMPVADVDIATSAKPQTVTELADSAGIRTIPTGLEHGTVTVVVDGTAFEVTTFRRDVETFGRHAVVAFADSIDEDARRRDFTMNALYADASGLVHDPLNGLPDIQARRVRFIEDADTRIREDYLRSLRYFRFHAWYGDHAQGTDPDALSAIAKNLDGLATLPGERIGAEMMRLLAAPDPAPALAAMTATGVLHAVLPGGDPQFISPLVHLEIIAHRLPDPIRRLAALGGDNPELRLRLSRADVRALTQLKDSAPGLAEIAWRHGPNVAWDVCLLRQAMASQPLPPNAAAQIARGSAAIFPVTAADLMPRLTGKALGDALKSLERAWIASEFELRRNELLSLIGKEG